MEKGHEILATLDAKKRHRKPRSTGVHPDGRESLLYGIHVRVPGSEFGVGAGCHRVVERLRRRIWMHLWVRKDGGVVTSRLIIHEILEQIDAELAKEGVLMNIRAYEALKRLAKRLDQASPLGDLHIQPTQHNTGDYLVRVAASWYDRKYGTHRRFDASPGSTVIWLAQRPWRIKFPRLYGSFRPICWPLDGYPDEEEESAGSVIDALEYVEEFPPGLRIALPMEARQEIRRVFVFVSDTLHMLQDREQSTKIKEVRANLQTAVSRIMDAPRHHGESKWNSLEASEKALKGYLDFRKISYKPRHDLLDFWHQATEAGLQSGVLERDLALIECTAQVKYGDRAVSALEAVQAHQASIHVVRSCVDALPLDGWIQDLMNRSDRLGG